VESARSAAGNRKAPQGIRSATVSLLVEPGEDRYVVANEGKLSRGEPRLRLAACMQ
jgi:hypothetical protein